MKKLFRFIAAPVRATKQAIKFVWMAKDVYAFYRGIKNRKEFEMSGWKTKLAGIAAILTGLATVAKGVSESNWTEAYNGWVILLAGLAALGIGHKLDKNTAATNAKK